MNGSRDPSGTQPPQPPSVVILEICRLQTWWVRGKGLPLNRLPPPSPRRRGEGGGRRMRGNLLHVSFNRIRLKDKNMQQIKVLQRPLRV
ncbi:hypothetical protein GOC07_19505 [Sinorhizobium meliloti]|nr:hypothetical protein [Sinorhizobium meliloti]